MAISISTLAFLARASELTALVVSSMQSFCELPQSDPIQFPPLPLPPPPPPPLPTHTTPYLQPTRTILLSPPPPFSYSRPFPASPLVCGPMVILAAVASGIIIGGLFILHRAVYRAREDPAICSFSQTPSTVLSGAVQTPSRVDRQDLTPQCLALPRNPIKLPFSWRLLSNTLTVLPGPLVNDRLVAFTAVATSLTLDKLSELYQRYLKFYNLLKHLLTLPSITSASMYHHLLWSALPRIHIKILSFWRLLSDTHSAKNDHINMFAPVAINCIVSKLSELRQKAARLRFGSSAKRLLMLTSFASALAYRRFHPLRPALPHIHIKIPLPRRLLSKPLNAIPLDINRIVMCAAVATNFILGKLLVFRQTTRNLKFEPSTKHLIILLIFACIINFNSWHPLPTLDIFGSFPIPRIHAALAKLPLLFRPMIAGFASIKRSLTPPPRLFSWRDASSILSANILEIIVPLNDPWRPLAVYLTVICLIYALNIYFKTTSTINNSGSAHNNSGSAHINSGSRHNNSGSGHNNSGSGHNNSGSGHNNSGSAHNLHIYDNAQVHNDLEADDDLEIYDDSDNEILQSTLDHLSEYLLGDSNGEHDPEEVMNITRGKLQGVLHRIQAIVTECFDVHMLVRNHAEEACRTKTALLDLAQWCAHLEEENRTLLGIGEPPDYDQAIEEGAVDEWSAAVVSGAAAFASSHRDMLPSYDSLELVDSITETSTQSQTMRPSSVENEFGASQHIHQEGSSQSQIASPDSPTQ
ncbi:hypothetical protein C0989_002570 [Termitomyces sp. Mn162]|nr:hypothetical protein C0989_002570 [Termitomyces sp. Mn162]